jgi:uncharacterized protein YoxC
MDVNQKPAPQAIDMVSRVTSWVGSVQSLIIHTGIFMAVFILGIAGIASWDFLLLVLTTIVSLEAIYLAIFIQFTVNQQAKSLKEVEEDVAEISEDIDEIQEDVEELGEDMGEIQEDIEEITEDVGELQEDVEEMSEEEKEELERKSHQKVTLEQLTADIQRVLIDLEQLKKGK